MAKELTKTAYSKLVTAISRIFEKAHDEAYHAVRKALVTSYWEIGKRIVEVEQKHKFRAEYGKELIEKLSRDLTQKFGRGFSVTNLKDMRRFYIAYKIGHARAQLSWAHYRELLTVKSEATRRKLERLSSEFNWSHRKLKKIIQCDKSKQQELLFDTNEVYSLKHKGSHLIHVRKRLYTYKIIGAKQIHTDEEQLIVDVGFSTWVDISFKGIKSAPAGTVVESRKLKQSYSFKKLSASAKELYTYKAHIERVVDGDTVWVQVDCGFGVWTKQKLRLRGIDTPETHSRGGRRATAFVRKTLKEVPFVIIKTHGSDKYDRYLVDIFYQPGVLNPEAVLAEGTFLNQELIDLGYARIV